jgi:hypothetical protein
MRQPRLERYHAGQFEQRCAIFQPVLFTCDTFSSHICQPIPDFGNPSMPWSRLKVMVLQRERNPAALGMLQLFLLVG